MNKYKERAGTNLIADELSSKLKNCNTAESVIEILQDQAQGFRNHSGDGGKMMSRFKQVINVLFKLSTSPILVELVGIIVCWSFSLHVYATTLWCSLSRLQKQFSRQSGSSLPYVSSPQFTHNSIHDICEPQAIRDVNGSYDALGELFELFENFLRRLNIYVEIKVQSAEALTEIVVKILVELLATLALATRQVKQGKWSTFILRQCLVLNSASNQKS